MSGSDRARRSWNRLVERLVRRDVYLIVVTMLVIYAIYIGLGAVLGFNVNGQVNALRRLTFLIAAYAMAGLALNLHWGYTGLFNVGVVGFMAVAIYVMGIATAPVDPASTIVTPGLGLPVVVGIALGVLAAAIAGLVVAFPALRLRSDYLAITTLGFAEIVRISLTSNTLKSFTLFGVEMGTAGNQGLNLVGDPSKAVSTLFETGYGIGVLQRAADAIVATLGAIGVQPRVVTELAYVVLLVGIVWAFYWTFMQLGRSPFGRVLKAVRDDEDVANSLGKNVQLVKIKSFVIGAAFLGLAGIFWHGSRGLATPGTFKTEVTVFVWIVVIIGGAGSNTGSVLGSALFVAFLLQGPRYVRTVLNETMTLPNAPLTIVRAGEALTTGQPIVFLSFVLDRLNSLQFLILGIVLIYVVQKRPLGLLGHRKEIAATISLERPGSARTDDRETAGQSAPRGADE
ncbi:MAG: branched-chain amino acid ABC transporter permease [Halobacteriales archaeon]|nr:branched-chain amino acid ABC transporter permease [Halobacteriales archaeon]